MLRPVLRCKIHRAVVTDSSLDYVGSMGIPEDMMKLLDIREGEQVEIANVNNGERWTTYAISEKKARTYTLNGAAARCGQIGDRLIIMIYALLDEKELKTHRMKVAFLDDKNNIVKVQD
ncbi:MAG TPA: aspartate 1-decarboxylase [Planctomycetota bacterium]|jgi:aspartate 1-decarboxylase